MFEIVMRIDDFLIQLVKYCTGIKSLDAMVRISRSALLKCSPRLNQIAMNLLYMISNTGLPASFYLYSKEIIVKQIKKQIEIEKQK